MIRASPRFTPTSPSLASFIDGVRRVAAAPMLVLGMYAVTLAATLPAALVLRGAIADHLGSSTVAAAAADGFDAGWWAEFDEDATGLARTFGPWVIGFAAPLFNLSALADNRPPPGAVAALFVAYVAAWAFLVGGVIDRLARQRRLRTAGFLAACGVYFWRLVRLALLAGVAHVLLLGVLHPWLFGYLAGVLTRDVTVERDAAVVTFVLYGLYGAVFAGVGVVFDYARIRAIVEDRLSMLGALLAALRFIRRRPAAVAGLWLLNAALFVLVLAAYALAAPGATTAGAAVWGAFLIGQAYIAARLFAKLVVYASQTAYFQSQLAHATYVARPRPRWPDSPAAEAITGPPR